MSSRGISPVIASIILVFVVLSLAGAYSVFTGRVAGTQVEAGQQRSQELVTGLTTAFKIEGVEKQDVVVRNIGSQTIPRASLSVVIDDTALNYTMAGDIPKGATGRLSVQGLWRVGPGEHVLKVQGAATSDTLIIEIEPADGNVLELRFDEGSGERSYNSNGPESGAIINGTRWVQGKFGTALDFDGQNDAFYIDFQNVSSGDAPITYGAWIKPKKQGWDSVITGRLPDGSFGYQLTVDKDSTKVRGYMNIGSWHNVVDGNIQPDVWSHVIVSYDGSHVRTYVNGLLSYTQDESANSFSGFSDMYVGNHFGYSQYFNGTIDEVVLYATAYAPDELYIMKPA